MITRSILQYLLSSCPHCHGRLNFEPWQKTTFCSNCGTCILLQPQTSPNWVPAAGVYVKKGHGAQELF